MKHSIVNYSCDRCGKNIKKGKEHRFNGIYSTECGIIIDFFNADLCPKCKKDFERFMKNGKL